MICYERRGLCFTHEQFHAVVRYAILSFSNSVLCFGAWVQCFLASCRAGPSRGKWAVFFTSHWLNCRRVVVCRRLYIYVGSSQTQLRVICSAVIARRSSRLRCEASRREAIVSGSSTEEGRISFSERHVFSVSGKFVHCLRFDLYHDHRRGCDARPAKLARGQERPSRSGRAAVRGVGQDERGVAEVQKAKEFALVCCRTELLVSVDCCSAVALQSRVFAADQTNPRDATSSPSSPSSTTLHSHLLLDSLLVDNSNRVNYSLPTPSTLSPHAQDSFPLLFDPHRLARTLVSPSDLGPLSTPLDTDSLPSTN